MNVNMNEIFMRERVGKNERVGKYCTHVTIHSIWIKGRTHEDILQVICFSVSVHFHVNLDPKKMLDSLNIFLIIYLFNFIVDIFTDIPIPPHLLTLTHSPISLSSGHHHIVV